MINNSELNISNKSYINKDFVTIFNELMDTAIQLSTKYNFESSNESDPIVVLTKLVASVGDKLCYLGDKNILERFPTSATQYNSMKEDCEELGYNMHYYIASKTTLEVTYNNLITTNQDIILPAFETKFSNNSGEINFVSIEDARFNTAEYTKTIPVIQGELKLFTALNEQDKSIVTLQDLDMNNRLYFPEVMVAQNGVFIDGGIDSTDDWTLVDNLNVQPIKSKVYLFGYDSSVRLPYIQFPSDITYLIGDGLTIRYVVTNGKNGNVQANDINTLLINAICSDEEVTKEQLDSSNFIVNNVNSANNGDDIESINDAYNSFKKTVGTFDTLVTCRDYANYIYKLMDNENIYPRVSNCQVTDRRDDYNFSNQVMTYNEYGETFKTEVEDDTLTAFDLCLYPLNPMTSVSSEYYKASFKPLNDTNKIKKILEESQTISHNYYDISGDDVYAIKNKLYLDAKISTTYKVNELEQLSIRNNILLALMKNFNARKIDYGYEIPFDTILSVIENADSRIKSVSLNEPEVKSFVMTKDGDDSTSIANSLYKPSYIAKNILSGKVPLWKYFNNFTWEYGDSLSDNSLVQNVVSADTVLSVPTSSDEYNYTLQKNEVIQLMRPNYIETAQYPYGWFYKTEGLESTINKNTVYELSNTEKIYLYEVEDDGSYTRKYTLTNTLIQPNFDLQIKPVSGTDYGRLNTKDIISVVKPNKDILNKDCYLYWITQDIATDDTKTLVSKIPFQTIGSYDYYVLQENEYLYRTDRTFNVLFTYGPGTLIKCLSSTNALKTTEMTLISESDISTNGLLGIKDLFKSFQFNSNLTLDLIEQQIVTLVEDDTFKSDNSASDVQFDDGTKNILCLINSYSDTDSKVYYKFSEDTEFTQFKALSSSDILCLKARLDIDSGPDKSQTVLENQTIKINYTDGDVENPTTSSTTLDLNSEFKLKYEKQLCGGQGVNLQYYSALDSLNTRNATILDNELYSYDYISGNTPESANTKNGIVSSSDNKYSKYSIKTGADSFTISLPYLDGKDVAVMLYMTKGTGVTDDIKLSLSNVSTISDDVIVLNGDSTMSGSDLTIAEGMTCLIFKCSASNKSVITFTPESDFSGNLVMSKPKIIDGTYNGTGITNNTILDILSGEEANILMSILNSYTDFYYNCNIDNNKAIDIDNILSPYALYDYNNVANKITISEIDIDYAIEHITIAKSSKL